MQSANTLRYSLNCHALNPSKSDAILLGTHQRNSTLPNISQINVVGSIVPLSDSVKLLGVLVVEKSRGIGLLATVTPLSYEACDSCALQLGIALFLPFIGDGSEPLKDHPAT